MAPPEGSKQKRHRPNFKKASSSGKCASSCSGKIPAVPLQVGEPASVTSEAESPKAEHQQPGAHTIGHHPPAAPEVRFSQAASPKKKPSQVSGPKTGSLKGPPQQNAFVKKNQQPEIPKGKAPKASSPKKGVSKPTGPLKSKPPQPGPPITGTLESASQIAPLEVRGLQGGAQAEVPSQDEKKIGSEEKQPHIGVPFPERTPVVLQQSSSRIASSPICTTSLETISSCIPASTDSVPPCVREENCPLLFSVKDPNISSGTVGRAGAELLSNSGVSRNTTMSQATTKLDNLCHLLENIVIQHTSKETLSDSTTKPPVASAARAAKEVSPAKVIPTAAESNIMLESRQAVEHERKNKKEAKKTKKKGGEKGKSGDDNASSKKEENKIGASEAAATSNTREKQTGDKHKPPQQTQQTRLSDGPQGSSQEDATGKSKADLKRERREKQEAQRQAKMAAKAQQEAEKQHKGQEQVHPSNEKTKPPQKKKKFGSEGGRWRDKKSFDKGPTGRRIPLLGHLTPHSSQPPQLPVNCDTIHPAVRTLGLKMKDHIVDGSTARVVSTLAALKRLISDYRTPESCDLSRDLAEKLLPNVSFLNACRSQAIAMDNAIRFLKHKINSIEPTMPEAQAKDQLRTAIDDYVQENINLASSTIASHAASLIQDGDVILTFGYSALVSDVVEAVRGEGHNVSIVVADSPHPASGTAMIKRLSSLGVTTYYRLITDVTHIMPKVTKVVVEAEAVMMNGAIQGMCGTAGLALAAATHDTPFIVLCYTYKFCNNDLTDSLVVNELGDPDSVVMCPSKEYCGHLADWRETQNLNVVSLVYDVTPASLVTVLVTEQSVLPTSAVPVIIRRNYADILGQD